MHCKCGAYFSDCCCGREQMADDLATILAIRKAALQQPMGPDHPNFEAALSWANGISLEYFNPTSKQWVKSKNPRGVIPLFQQYLYREAKPKPRLRVYHLKQSGYKTIQITTRPEMEKEIQNTNGFVKWLTDWIEYDE